MSDTLRPWLRNFVLKHARNSGTALEPVAECKQKCQIIRFRTYDVDDDPCGPPRGLWAEISDGYTHMPVHFPRETVDAFQQTQKEALTKFRGGLLRVRPTAFLCQQLPKDPSSLERDARLALRVEVLEYIGSAGEPTFKTPQPAADDPAIRMWVRALRGDADAEARYQQIVEQTLTEDVRTAWNLEYKHSGLLAGHDPRVQPQHRRNKNSSSGADRKGKRRDSVGTAAAPPRPPTPELSAKQKILADYSKSWGQKRSMQLKWYTIPAEQRDELNKLDFLTDDEAIRRQLPLRPPDHPRPLYDALDLGSTQSTARRATTAAASPSPSRMPPSSLPTQTASSSEASRDPSPDLGPLGGSEVGDDDSQAISWSPSPAPQRRAPVPVEVRRSSPPTDCARATPRPPPTPDPIILVPNSDPSSKATNSQQTQSQQSASSRPNGSQQFEQPAGPSSHRQSSLPPPTHVSETAPPSSQPGGRVKQEDATKAGDESITASSVTASQSQSQPQIAVLQESQPATMQGAEAVAMGVDHLSAPSSPHASPNTQPAEESPATRPADEESAPTRANGDASEEEDQLADSDAQTEAFLVAHTLHQGKKRARESDAAFASSEAHPKRTRRSAEEEAVPSAAGPSSSPAAGQGRTLGANSSRLASAADERNRSEEPRHRSVDGENHSARSGPSSTAKPRSNGGGEAGRHRKRAHPSEEIRVVAATSASRHRDDGEAHSSSRTDGGRQRGASGSLSNPNHNRAGSEGARDRKRARSSKDQDSAATRLEDATPTGPSAGAKPAESTTRRKERGPVASSSRQDSTTRTPASKVADALPASSRSGLPTSSPSTADVIPNSDATERRYEAQTDSNGVLGAALRSTHDKPRPKKHKPKGDIRASINPAIAPSAVPNVQEGSHIEDGKERQQLPSMTLQDISAILHRLGAARVSIKRE